ncbi:HNH endonuclease [Streptomyces sp. NPDC001276]|uniref:HNH endonuclease n=1 Tax=Streptomyces sp. NPDC001276 TaxID=3364555 RepID=UPI00368EB70B
MTNATRPAFITCARCGTEKKVGLRGPIPTYCSGACRASLKYERSREDGRYERALTEGRQRTAARQAANQSPCPFCGAPMLNPRRKQCGAALCKKRYQAERVREWQRAYRAKHGQWCRPANYAEQQREYNRQRRQEQPHWRQMYPDRAAAYDARRRALVAEARTEDVFAPIEVHTRDNWTCRLCLLPIDPEVAWPDPMSPSIDHRIPLSRGGAHALSNVQSAHLGCNSRKCDRDMVDMVIRLGQAAPR